MTIKIGDRVQLVALNFEFRGEITDEYSELKPGDEGVIVDIEAAVGKLWVEWDDGSLLALLVHVDNFTVI